VYRCGSEAAGALPVARCFAVFGHCGATLERDQHRKSR